MAKGLHEKLALNGRVLRSGHRLLCRKIVNGVEGEWRWGTVVVENHLEVECMQLDLGDEKVDLKDSSKLDVAWTEAQARRVSRDRYVTRQVYGVLQAQPMFLVDVPISELDNTPYGRAYELAQRRMAAYQILRYGKGAKTVHKLSPEVMGRLEREIRRFRRKYTRQLRACKAQEAA